FRHTSRTDIFTLSLHDALPICGESAAVQPNARENYLIEFVDVIIERGHHYGIPTLDLYRTSGLNEENHATFFEDHVHPNDQGFELIGNTVTHFLIDTYNKQ